MVLLNLRPHVLASLIDPAYVGGAKTNVWKAHPSQGPRLIQAFPKGCG